MQYLEKFQGIKFQEPVWFKAGAVILNEPLNYLGQDNLVGARSIIATLAVQASCLHSTSHVAQSLIVVLEMVHFPSDGRLAVLTSPGQLGCIIAAFTAQVSESHAVFVDAVTSAV